MFAYKNGSLVETSPGNPHDSSLEKIKFSTVNGKTEEGCDFNPMRTASLLLKIRAVRLEQSRNSIPCIDDIAWHILLDLMVASGTGKTITAVDLAITHDVAKNTMYRYVDYLTDNGLIAKSTETEDEKKVPLKLTVSGEALASKVLRKCRHDLVNF